MGGRQPIDPNEAVALFEDVDLTRYFLLLKPGPYEVKIREGNYGIRTDPFPASNTVTIEVRSGTPRKEDLVSQKLIAALPNGKWEFGGRYSSENLAPVGREHGVGSMYALSTMRVPSRLKRDVVLVQIWQMQNRVERQSIDRVNGPGELSQTRSSEFLGKGDGYIYVSIPSHATVAWPSIQSNMKRVFGIESVSELK